MEPTLQSKACLLIGFSKMNGKVTCPEDGVDWTTVGRPRDLLNSFDSGFEIHGVATGLVKPRKKEML